MTPSKSKFITSHSRTMQISLEGQTPLEITFDTGVTLRVRWDNAESGIKVTANEIRPGILATELVVRPRQSNSMILEVE